MDFHQKAEPIMSYTLGMIHGRFQPFHLEHLRYFQIAWEQSEKVIVGITNPDPSAIVEDPLSDHRHRPEDNPFTFTERLMMIQGTLVDEGFPLERVLIVPLPIHHPDRWRYYIPPDTVMFIVSYSPWECRKAQRIREAGYDVIEVDSLKKGISGRDVRATMKSGGDWESLVPPAVERCIKELRKIRRQTGGAK
jgi:nicotinamide mononucleotide adenylyltransferase